MAITYGEKTTAILSNSISYTGNGFKLGHNKILCFYEKKVSGTTYPKVGIFQVVGKTLSLIKEVDNPVPYECEVRKISDSKFLIVGTPSTFSSTALSAVVGEIDSNDDITFGTVVECDSGGMRPAIDIVDETKFILFDTMANREQKAVIGTISGTTITFGTKYTVFAGTNDAVYNIIRSRVIYLGSSKFILLTSDNYAANDAGKAIIGTISGTTISFGTAYTFSDTLASEINAELIDTDTILVSYKKSEDGLCKKLTISGTTITGGSAYTFSSDLYRSYLCKLGDNFVLSYFDYTTEYSLKSRIVIINHDGSISFGDVASIISEGEVYNVKKVFNVKINNYEFAVFYVYGENFTTDYLQAIIGSYGGRPFPTFFK